ncbi:MAG TPA: glycosyltransferase [Flavobacterium sp.]|nr:glycosyltransferase [Flavobacterium sp.]
MPLFSVVIPLFNKENFIEDTLKSVLSQTFTDFEIIIINDGSTDKSGEKVLAFADSRIRYFSIKNQGVSAARNFGIARASGKFIAFLDADDYWYPHFLESMESMAREFPDKQVFSSAIEVQIEDSIFEASYSIPRSSRPQVIDFFKGSLGQTAIWTSGGCFDTSIFRTVGGFNEDLKTDEDIDMWIRIGLRYPVVFNPKVAARYNYDPKGLSKDWDSLASKTNFSSYSELEKTNPGLRRYLSTHRFSMALKCKISDQRAEFNRFYRLVNLKDLSRKQRFLIALPGFVLRKLFDLKLLLHRKKIRLSAFK